MPIPVTKRGKPFFLLFLLLLSISLLFLLNSGWLVKTLAGNQIKANLKDLPHIRVALVPGTSSLLKNGHINPWFGFRMDAAAQLFKSGKVDKIIVSGDHSRKGYNEPEKMKWALVRLGIPESAIVEDYAGFRTFDSVFRAKAVFGQNALIVVTQRGQLERALLIAKKLGIKAWGFPAKSPKNELFLKTYHKREKFAAVKCLVDYFNPFAKPKYLGKPEKV